MTRSTACNDCGSTLYGTTVWTPRGRSEATRGSWCYTIRLDHPGLAARQGAGGRAVKLWIYNEEWRLPAAMRPSDREDPEDLTEVPDDVADRYFRALRRFLDASKEIGSYRQEPQQ